MAIGPDRNASSTASPEIYSKNAKRCRVGALVGKEQQHNSDERYRFRKEKNFQRDATEDLCIDMYHKARYIAFCNK